MDETYTPPPGVHLSLWRYVQIPGSTACPTTASTGQIWGSRPNDPTACGTPSPPPVNSLDLTDRAGVDLHYGYDTSTPTFLQLNSSGVVAGLGRLRTVSEPALTTALSCHPGDVSCRGYKVTYSDTDPASCPKTTFAFAVCVSDVAAAATDIRTTTYYFDGTNPFHPVLAASHTHLLEVKNPDGIVLNYRYWPDSGCPSGPAGATDQLCSVSDLNAHTSTVNYTAPGGAFAGSLPAVSTITDRRNIPTTFSFQSDGAVTTVDAAPDTSTTCTTGVSACHRVQYSGIDAAGRVSHIAAGPADGASNSALHVTDLVWDSASATCRQPDNLVDNNLCTFTRRSLDTDTPDETTSYSYTAEGAPLTIARTLTGTTKLVTSYGYHVQYRQVSGSSPSQCVNYQVSGSGAVGRSATGAMGCRAPPTNPVPAVWPDDQNTPWFTGGHTTLFALSDRTQMLPPRGNSASGATGYQAFLTTIQVDDNATADPNPTLPTTPTQPAYCTSSSGGPGSGNSGVVCETDAPAPTGAGSPPSNGPCTPVSGGPGTYACTRNMYDGYGARVKTLTPNAAAEGDAFTTSTSAKIYSYGYYADTATDLSGRTSAGGWLAAVRDPNGKFVSFAYDAAGNPVRSWDRDTNERTSAGYSNVVTSAPTGIGYTETDLGPYSADSYDPTNAADTVRFAHPGVTSGL